MATDWITAAEAFKRIAEATSPVTAQLSICSRARAGLVVARAKLFIRDKVRHEDSEVPAEFWWAGGQAALKQNWATGDFDTWIDQREHWLAYGVEFVRAHIDEMLPGTREQGRAAKPGNYAPASQCLNELKAALDCPALEASALLVRHSRAGLVPSRCSNLWWRMTTRYGDEDASEEKVAIPDWVWETCLSSPDAILNWPANLFAGEGSHDGDHYKVKVSGVEFAVDAVVAVEQLEKVSRAERNQQAALPPQEVASIARGRPLSKQWPEWVAELALTIHEQGIPAGEGAQGQEELIRTIADHLAERGIEGPSRTTVQPVIQAVLQRLRSAGN